MGERLVVIGQGYVGLPLALAALSVGMEVTGLELSRDRVDALNAGISHVDDVSDSELSAAVHLGYRATTDATVLADAEVIVVCVPTPLAESGGIDLTAVEVAARQVGEHVSPGTLCLLESTTYPGTTEEVFAPLVCAKGFRVGHDINIGFSPERVDPGNETYGIRNTPKVVGGITAACAEAARAFYSRFVDTVVVARGVKEAEMAKLIENTFRHVNIALVNEMVRFCEELGIDLWNSIDCAETKPFGYLAFRPGPGVGGHCIPVDPTYLSHRVKAKLGYAFRMVELAEEINSAAPAYVAARVSSILNDAERSVKGSKVLLLGITYKPDVRDQRESPADPIAAKLASWGAQVSYHDPFVSSWSPKGADVDALTSVANPYTAAQDADVVVLLQRHSFYDMDLLSQLPVPLFDTRGTVPQTSTVIRL